MVISRYRDDSNGDGVYWDGSAEDEALYIAQISIAAVPSSLTRRQAKLILLQYGLLDEVEGVVTSLPRSAQIEYADALSFERHNPLIMAVATMASMTVEQVDQMFVEGSVL